VSLAGLTLITYVWHYLVARLLYEELLQPLVRGHSPRPASIAALAVAGALLTAGFLLGAGFGLGRLARRRAGRAVRRAR
jgi:hypothetical protein